MTEAPLVVALPPPGGVAWLDISYDSSGASTGRTRTGPLGMQITPLYPGRRPCSFQGARLRGTRCIWTAATVRGAELVRRHNSFPGYAEGAIHLMVRGEAPGSVFDRSAQAEAATLRVVEPLAELREVFGANTHLFTLNVQANAMGVEPALLLDMTNREFDLSTFQLDLLRSAMSLLGNPGDQLTLPGTLLAVDRYLGALGGLLVRTTARSMITDVELMESIRHRTTTLVFEQAADASLSPASIAAQLDISLRQLYRAFSGTESPAARIRRRRLERAAELLMTSASPVVIETVAQACGFVSGEYFSRAFRREFGLSPRAYRSTHRDSGVDVQARVSS
jgi:AraC-like DNA-binding protein